ncbi:hypothetical protein GCM10028807_17650 [Spirosoma daeguense]
MLVNEKQRQALERFVASLEGKYNGLQYDETKAIWAKDSPIWRHIRQGTTGQLRLICWYNNTHKPGSKEFRPQLIIQAALEHVNTPHSQGYYFSKSTLVPCSPIN